MSHGGQENQGTGLRDVFDALVKVPQERLLSLTLQLGESAEENLVCALCLIVLQREAQALNKLEAMGDNCLAKHLAEKWQMSGGKLEDFSTQCGSFQEFTQESLSILARIFKVLSEQKLCDPLQRDLAYRRALSSSEDVEYDPIREEAKVVCGPQAAEWICSPTKLNSESFHDLYHSADEENTTLKVSLSQDQSERAHSLPSPLLASSSMLSYPTHLEISIPPTMSFQGDKVSPEPSDRSKLNTPIFLFSEEGNKPEQSQEPQLRSIEAPSSEASTHPKMDEKSAAVSINLGSLTSLTPAATPTTGATVSPPAATNIFLPMKQESNGAEEEEEEEEEAIFYAFVILHAPEDADVAESMKVRLERVISDKGATFSDDFATPGRSTLRCVEDAINNTAFTILLLTRNFNTRMQEIETNSALINSVNKKHKYNTVIPLLPHENSMPKQSIPLVLQTIVPLVENRSFEGKIRKLFSPAKIGRYRQKWMEEQRVKKEKERQERLKRSNEHEKQLIKECKMTLTLEEEGRNLQMARRLLEGDSRACWHQQPNIHINNARYIMIGNDSQMTVDLGGGAHKDDPADGEEEQ